MFESVATISGDREPAAAGADGAGTGADAVDGAGATAAEVAAAGAAAGTTSSVGADLGLPSASEAGGLSHGADPAGAEGRPRSPPTRAAPAGTTGAAATTEAPASWRSRVSTRSARASNVTSASGRTMRVSAISKVSRGFVDVFSSPATSPKTPRSRARRSTPNSGSSSESSRRVVSDTSSTTSGPATAITYMLRICSARVRDELGHVGAGFHVLGHPAEARRRVAGAYRPHDVGQIRGVHSSQHPLGHFHGHRTVAEGDELLQRSERVAHAALGPMRDELQGLPFELHVLGGADGPQARHHGFGGDAAEIEALAARVNGLGHLLRVGGGQDEHHVARRLLQRLQQAR